MFVLRFLVPIAALVLAGLGAAWLVTRDRKYLRLAFRGLQLALLLAVAFALLYVFERLVLL